MRSGRDDTWLVVGADGGIGGGLFRRLAAAGLPAQGTTRRAGVAQPSVNALDLAAPSVSWNLPPRVAVAYLCAAVTSGEECRRSPEVTRLVNVERTLDLARMLRDRGALVVFLSTNQVFDGSRPHRLAEDRPCPETEYGRQKAEAEAEILALGGAVVRLTKVFTRPPALFRSWADALAAGETVAPLADMVFSPVPPGVATDALVAVGSRRARGVVQVSGERDVSYAEVANAIADQVGASRLLVRPGLVAARGLHPGSAPRHTTLDTRRLVQEFEMVVPPVETTVEGLVRDAAPGSQRAGNGRAA